MTLDEAKQVAAIIGTADNGCSTCVGNLLAKLNDAFPMFSWLEGEEISASQDNDWQSSIAVRVFPRPMGEWVMVAAYDVKGE